MNSIERLKSVNHNPDINTFDLDDLISVIKELRFNVSVICEEELPKENDLNVCISLLLKLVDLKPNENDHAKELQCIRLGVQFLGNLTVRSSLYREVLWNQHKLSLRAFFFVNDSKLKNYVSMIYYNILLSHPELNDVFINDLDLLESICEEASHGSEYPQFIIEKILALGSLKDAYALRKIHQRLYILDLFNACIEGRSFSIKNTDVEFLSSCFKRKANSILNNLEKDENSLSSQETSKILSNLCSLSSIEDPNRILQNDKSLIIDCIYLLKALYSLQKSDLPQEEKLMSLNSHVIGFKGDLIRILGNLCWKNKINQDLIRENNCIHIFLDSFKIDEKNPFIMEWSIFAIRNMCEKNQDNQDFISSLQKIDLTVPTSLI